MIRIALDRGIGEDESGSQQTVMMRLNSLGELELDPVFLTSDTLTEAQPEVCVRGYRLACVCLSMSIFALLGFNCVVVLQAALYYPGVISHSCITEVNPGSRHITIGSF